MKRLVNEVVKYSSNVLLLFKTLELNKSMMPEGLKRTGMKIFQKFLEEIVSTINILSRIRTPDISGR